MLGSAALAAGSAAAGIYAATAGSKKQYKYQSRLQREAAQLNYDYGIKSLENSPTATRKGLTDAGYNPMLAVQNATSGANAGWTSAGQASAPDYNQSVSNAMDALRVGNETKNTDSTVQLNNSTAFKNRMEGIAQQIKNKFISSREKSELTKIGKEITNIESDTQLKTATVDNMKARLELDRQLGFMGLDVQRRGQDKAYNASTYATDVNAETQRGMRTDRLPFGFGSTYYDKRSKEYLDWSDNKYWKGYGY